MATAIYCPNPCTHNNGKDGLGLCSRSVVIMDPVPAAPKEPWGLLNDMTCRYYKPREDPKAVAK